MKNSFLVSAGVAVAIGLVDCSHKDDRTYVSMALMPISSPTAAPINRIIDTVGENFARYCPITIDSSISSPAGIPSISPSSKGVSVREFEDWFRKCDPRIQFNLRNYLEAMNFHGPSETISTYHTFIAIVREYVEIYTIYDALPKATQNYLLISGEWGDNIEFREYTYNLNEWLPRLSQFRIKLEQMKTNTETGTDGLTATTDHSTSHS